MIVSVTSWITLIIGIFHFCGGQEDRISVQGRWQDNIRPKLFAHLSTRDYQSFSGILLNDPSTGRNSSSREIGNSLRYMNMFQLYQLESGNGLKPHVFMGLDMFSISVKMYSLFSSSKTVNSKNNGDHFTTMLYTNIVDDHLLVGAKNILYKLNAQELRLTQTLRWNSLEPEIDNCLVKGKTILECQNYIKVLEQYKVRDYFKYHYFH
jgi:hypothetical protein